MSKRKDADAAYERQEDQRALAVVLAAATDGMTYIYDRGHPDPDVMRIAAAIERVKANLLRIETPKAKPEPGLPGQIDIDGTVTGAPVGEPRELGSPMAEAFGVPTHCPHCNADMLTTWGGHWTPCSRAEGEAYNLQCGFCAHVIVVSEAAYDAIVVERRRTVGASDKLPVKLGRPERVRGAG